MTATLNSGKRIMRDSIRQLFPTGRTLTALLTHVSRGMAADALIEQGNLPDDEVAIVLLPQFSIRDFEGSESVNRIQWDGDAARTVRLVRYGETAHFAWGVEDSTLDALSGVLTVSFDSQKPVISGDFPPLLNADIVGRATIATATGDAQAHPVAPTAIHVFNGGAIARRLHRISQHGNAQMFALASLLQPYARDAVNSASMRVYREIHGIYSDESGASTSDHIIDEIERESVLDQLMLGTRQTDSVMIRMIRRVAATNITVRKSVMSVMATAIWSGAETQVRQQIGDPHLGRVIRRLARDLSGLTGIPSVDATNVLEAYKAAFPDQRVGINRVVDALTAGSTVHSLTVRFDVDGGTIGGADA